MPRFVFGMPFLASRNPLPFNGENRMNPLDHLVIQARADFSAAQDAAALENAKALYLGKTGQITEQMKLLGKLAPDAKIHFHAPSLVPHCQ